MLPELSELLLLLSELLLHVGQLRLKLRDTRAIRARQTRLTWLAVFAIAAWLTRHAWLTSLPGIALVALVALVALLSLHILHHRTLHVDATLVIVVVVVVLTDGVGRHLLPPGLIPLPTLKRGQTALMTVAASMAPGRDLLARCPCTA